MSGHRARVARAGRRSVGGRVVGVAAVAAALLLTMSALTGQVARKPDRAVVVPIRGTITDIMRDSVERRLEAAQAAGAQTVIFEMDTPGGMVTSALDICRLIKSLPEDVHTVAWVHPQALSAGAMISVACKQILMSDSSRIGDCAPIMITPVGGLQELGETERAKAESPVLQEFRDSAARNGYDPLLCRAMVTVGEEVWWVQDSESGARRFVSAGEKKTLIDDVDQPARRWRPVESYADPRSGRDVPVPQPVDKAGELLTLSQGEAVAYGLASGIAGDLKQVQETLALSEPPLYHDTTGWEEFAMWLNSPLVRGLLFVIVIIGAYIEFQSPGLILPGATAAVALVIFLAAPYAAGLADVWTILLLVVGLILLGLEIFVIPGFGIAGILGILLILVSFVGTFVPREPGAPLFSWPSLDATWHALKMGVIVLSSSLIIALIGIMLLARYLPELPGARRLILQTPDRQALALEDPYEGIALVGDVGIVVGDLRPGGQARFGTEVVDVHSQGEYVEAGRRVQVLKHEGPHIVVRPLPNET